MTAGQTGHFEELDADWVRPVDTAEHSFKAWAGFGTSLFQDAAGNVARPALPVKRRETARDLEDRLMAGVKEKEKDLARREAAFTARVRDLDAREEALNEREQELDARAVALDRMAATLAGTAREFEEMKKGFWMENAPEIASFAVALAEKIVMDRVAKDPAVIARHVAVILEKIETQERVSVFTAPEDLEALRALGHGGVDELLKHERLSWSADARLKSGELRIDTSEFRLDASLATALKNMKQDLLAEITASDDGRRPEDGGNRT